MKKIISMLLVAVICCGLLAGCGGKPEDVSQEVYDLGVETCDILDDYIQGKMSQDTAADKLDKMHYRANVVEKKGSNDGVVVAYIMSAYTAVDDIYVDDGETYKAEDALEKLKEELNL